MVFYNMNYFKKSKNTVYRQRNIRKEDNYDRGSNR